MENRYYQDDQLKAILSNYKNGVRRQVISAATGTGKTICFSQIPLYMEEVLPGQMLVLAHRDELLDQNIAKLQTANPALKIAKEKAHEWADFDADVIVASVATLGRKGSQRSNRFNWDKIDKVITDECHHATADSYKRVYEAAGVLDRNTTKLHIGFTATPQRADKKGLAEIFDSIVHEYPLRKAIEDSFLVDVKGVRIRTGASLSDVRTVGGDFALDELANAVNTPQRNQLAVRSWLDNAKDRQTVAFTVDIQHALDLAAMFQHHGVNAEAVWGNDPDRAEKLKRHKNDEITILTNCGVLTEGYDSPNISCILLCRPTRSSVLYVQMVGRGTRLFQGKHDCMVVDLVDVSNKHSLVTLPTLLGLSASLDLKGRSLVKSVQLLENKQREYSHIDFSTLADISQIETFIESVDLFNIRIPEEVEANSTFVWHPAVDGGYTLNLPNRQQLRIGQDLLDKWHVTGAINGTNYRGERGTLAEAFQCADNLVTTKIPESVKLVQRTGTWQGKPVTPQQLDLLAKLLKGKPIKNGLTSGEASVIIGQLLNKGKK